MRCVGEFKYSTPNLFSLKQRVPELTLEFYLQLLEQGNKLVLEQVVTTLASVADTAEEKFVNYYDRYLVAPSNQSGVAADRKCPNNALLSSPSSYLSFFHVPQVHADVEVHHPERGSGRAAAAARQNDRVRVAHRTRRRPRQILARLWRDHAAAARVADTGVAGDSGR